MTGVNEITNSAIQLAKHVCTEQSAKAAIIIWFVPGKAGVSGVGIGSASYGVNKEIYDVVGGVLDEIDEGLEQGFIDTNELAIAIHNLNLGPAREQKP